MKNSAHNLVATFRNSLIWFIVTYNILSKVSGNAEGNPHQTGPNTSQQENYAGLKTDNLLTF